MRKLTAAITTVAAMIGAPAFAADLPVKAPPPPPAPVFSWTGWYVGGNVGYGSGHAHTDLAGNGTTTSFSNQATIGTAATFASSTTPALTSPFAFTHSDTARLSGVIGGGQFGYNYQFSPNWVLGFEADLQGSGQHGSSTFTDPFSTFACIIFIPGGCEGGGAVLIPGTATTFSDRQIEWFGTVRARLGYLIANQVLVYGTGGLTYGGVSVSGSTNVFANSPFTPLISQTVGFGASKTNIGYSVGGGIEGRFSNWLPPNWTWKLEYLYLDLGSRDTGPTPFAASVTNVNGTFVTTGTISTHTHFTDNIVRVGVNYQFH